MVAVVLMMVMTMVAMAMASTAMSTKMMAMRLAMAMASTVMEIMMAMLMMIIMNEISLIPAIFKKNGDYGDDDDVNNLLKTRRPPSEETWLPLMPAWSAAKLIVREAHQALVKTRAGVLKRPQIKAAMPPPKHEPTWAMPSVRARGIDLEGPMLPRKDPVFRGDLCKDARTYRSNKARSIGRAM